MHYDRSCHYVGPIWIADHSMRREFMMDRSFRSVSVNNAHLGSKLWSAAQFTRTFDFCDCYLFFIQTIFFDVSLL